MVDLTRTRRICSIVLIFLVQTACGYSAQRPASAPPPEQTQAKSTGQLKSQVDKLLACADPVVIRRGIADAFILVNQLVKAGQQKEAFHYLSAALKYYPWALDYQLVYAQMLLAQGQTGLARERAELVLQHAEQDAQVNLARRLLQKEPLPTLPKIGKIPGDVTTLVLVPIGDVDTCVLQELGAALRARLGIPLFVQDARVRAPRFQKDPLADHLSQARKSLQERMEKDERLVRFLQSRGISREDVEQDAGVVEAFREILFSAGDAQVLARFDADMERLRQADKQWDIGSLLNNLRVAVRSFRQERVYFLGVANLDAFEGQSNFIFGTAETGGHHAVVTYRRFTAAFNRDGPSRKRLLERTLKQSLSSIGFMFGVGRCSDPTCARAYPQSLAEHDAKSTDLCRLCRAAFERVPGVSWQTDGQTQPSQQERP